jgi:hypothetical protein
MAKIVKCQHNIYCGAKKKKHKLTTSDRRLGAHARTVRARHAGRRRVWLRGPQITIPGRRQTKRRPPRVRCPLHPRREWRLPRRTQGRKEGPTASSDYSTIHVGARLLISSFIS